MNLHTPYRMPRKIWLVNVSRVPLKLLLKLAVPLFAIRGRYPPLMVTPDDPVSPFGCGTTPGASREESMVAIYKRWGRYIGDCIWLGWRNSGYGVAYYCKPAWLKDPAIKYEDLTFDRESDGKDMQRIWLLQPDGAWLWETTRRFGPVYLITGYRIGPIYSGALENAVLLSKGKDRVPRPAFHPNMDGRPIVSLRTKRTL